MENSQKGSSVQDRKKLYEENLYLYAFRHEEKDKQNGLFGKVSRFKTAWSPMDRKMVCFCSPAVD